mmetsp:Transcript_15764/g.26137  ORF Transcript_15764/g.26137 Transcript_15764/m.26137 type:complete len:523 (-) Transcript_15764:78-1646(-)
MVHEQLVGDKRKRNDSEQNGSTMDESKILELLEQAPQVEALDSFAMKKMVLSLEKRISKNQEMRMKFSDAPDKFMDSEIDLHDELKKMHVLSTAPELYPEFLALNAHISIIQLLSHENTDIVIDTVELINELIDPEAVDDRQALTLLVDGLLEKHVLELLVQNLTRLDEKNSDDSQAVFNTFSILENMTEIKGSELSTRIGSETLIFPFLFKRLKSREMDANRLYASEILAILLQSSKENQQRLGDIDGIDSILKLIAPYKRRDPQSSEEIELMENLFNSLCSALLQPLNQNLFLNAEGLELMLMILKEKKRRAAIKVIDHALSRSAQNCDHFVDILGLKTLFSAFMRKGAHKRKRDADEEEDEEHVVSTVASLFTYLKGERHQRLLGKFKENDFEKVDRLLELHDKYLKQVAACEKKLMDEEPDLGKDQIYVEKLDNGLFTLQYVALIIGHLIASNIQGIRDRVKVLINQQDSSIDQVIQVLQELADNTGDALSKEERSRERGQIQSLVESLSDYNILAGL